METTRRDYGPLICTIFMVVSIFTFWFGLAAETVYVSAAGIIGFLIGLSIAFYHSARGH